MYPECPAKREGGGKLKETLKDLKARMSWFDIYNQNPRRKTDPAISHLGMYPVDTLALKHPETYERIIMQHCLH